MSKTLVTVVMATYNQARYVSQALDSLRAQTLSLGDFEVIVINDGSTDKTSEILQDYRGWIHLIERENRGLVTSCNEGLALARGRYLARLDSDDSVAPEWLECLVEALQSNPDACCAYPDRYEVDGDQWRYVEAEPGSLYSLEACGTLFRTDALREVDGFRPFFWEEYDLYLRLRQVGQFVHVPEPLYMYRRHTDSMTHSASKRLEGWLQLAEEWGADTLRSAGFDPDLDKALQLLEGGMLMGNKTIVIAEVGENHIGDWDLARKMVVAAAEAGADMVKFQSYLGAEVADDDPEKEWFTKVQLPNELHFEFKALAEQHGVEFLSSCFTLNRARFLVEELGLRKIKVASSEMLNFGLLDYLNGRVDTVFLSTGMATLDEVREAVSHLQGVKDLYILQCTTQYPCPPEQANLAVIPTLRAAFPQHHVGFSDHTLGTLAPVAAVALGAEVIEKHFTLDKSLPGTDHVLSMTPEELREMVSMIRQVEVLLGSAVKEPTLSEHSIVNFVRSRFPK